MASSTTKISKAQIKYIDLVFKRYKETNLKNPNLLALYKLKDLTISIFKNGTLLLQGQQSAIDSFWKKKSKTTTKSRIDLSNCDGTIGMDEVGTGDYFGPIVTCSCYVPRQNILKLKALGVDDSKKFSDEKIKQLVKPLRKLTQAMVGICKPADYNKLINQYNNTNIVKAMLHNNTLHEVKSKLKDSTKTVTILDQFVPRAKYYEYLNSINEPAEKIDIIEIKAESKYIAVACASIFARARFLEQMEALGKQARIVLPKGSVQRKTIVKAGRWIIDHGLNLSDFAKLNFKPITKEINN